MELNARRQGAAASTQLVINGTYQTFSIPYNSTCVMLLVSGNLQGLLTRVLAPDTDPFHKQSDTFFLIFTADRAHDSHRDEISTI